jgi:TolA-binding protein
MMRHMLFLLLLSSTLWAQRAGGQLGASAQGGQSQADTAGQAPPRPSPGDADDDLAQMRTDLNHMESLLNNMSSEITFLRDQNLQILLNSNARMWTILIRDLRLQIDREQQRRTGKKTPSAAERQVPQVKPPLFRISKPERLPL